MNQVLVVEDDETIREAIRLTLEDFEYDVLEAPDGRPVLDILRTHPHGLIVVLDRNMPHMDGQAVLEAVYAHPALAKRHQFLVLSADAGATLPLRLVELMDALHVEKVDKPFDIDDLLAAVLRADKKLQSSRRE
jgi:CheY-like chemotaxis protein